MVGGCAGNSAADTIPVEVWRSGDDGLTFRLSEKLVEIFKSSSSFSMSLAKKPGTLVVTIPRNVDWKEVGDRTQVLYSVAFSTAEGRQLGSSTGSCWDDNLTECAEQILKESTAAAKKIK